MTDDQLKETQFYMEIGDALEDVLIENIDHVEGAFTFGEIANIQVEKIKSLLSARLPNPQPVMSREAIAKAFEDANSGALEKEEYDFGAGFDAVYALQPPIPQAPQIEGMIKLTSDVWARLYASQFTIYDPDGWHRDGRFEHEFNEELITEGEFMSKVAFSTCLWHVGPTEIRPIDFQATFKAVQR